ncbi:leucine-rich repeat extensin-like protein 3 [Iris pallida]|uniref:Leucine-rich repeat extensin-like protein 3 n=1 Tax=Iris pallida TaxID=29817 RepID=A0AAX6F0I9_IRIPA|nr:leucine-rich repeat extensin-like protein 3 [Iris pallida]
MDLYMRCYPPREHRVHCACAFHLHHVLLCFHYMCTPVNLVLSCSRSPMYTIMCTLYGPPCDILCNNITCLDPCVLIGDTGEC